ncbi:MAG: recombination protein RecR [Deltaproteobacteria bacterium]|jgi:recombination protein RecR|nr:recombination protein RecR [Deltaproteobacteria bacterium]MBW2480427.1 recombination protein RecR [Deltaproteobacteria bacterium]
MSYYPASIQNLIKHIARLPGIGEKTAERLALHILRAPRREAEELAQSLLDIKDKVKFCSKCFALSDNELCHLCSDPARDSSVLCVVEQPADMVAIEKSGAFRGMYHVLSGALSPMNGIGPENIRIRELMSRLQTDQIQEIVLATATNVEGEATASYIAQLLEKHPIKVSRIASGVPMGGDLKYVDQVTLKRAMETRHAL